MKLKEKMKNNNHKKFDKKKLIGTISKKHIKNGSYTMVMSVIFIAVVVVLNMIVNAIPSKYSEIDISSQKLYSIGDDTKAMLKDLDKDVTIYQIAQSGSEDENITNLLKKYEDESKHIKVEQKDPVVNPKFVTEYTSDNLSANSLIVVCGDRNKVIDYNNIYESTIDYQTYSSQTTGFDGEGQITSAIGYVTSEDLPILYTLEGHGEKEMDSTIKEDIEKANMEMIFSDYTTEDMPNFDAVLENYGVQREAGIVFEGDNQHYAMQMPYYLVPTINSTDASSETVSGGYYVLAPYAQGIKKMDDVRDTVTINSILTTSDQAYSKTDLNSDTLEKEDGDEAGPFDLGVSITETLDDDKETQIVYYSTSNLMESQVNQMVSGGNEKLIIESLKWMTDTEDSATVSIPSKSLSVSYLTLTDYDAAFWKICTIGLIPGFFLVVGFAVWMKRRKA